MSDTSRATLWERRDAGRCPAAKCGRNHGPSAVTDVNTDASQSEVGLVATNFANVVINPVVMRKLRSSSQDSGQSQWELLISATGVQTAGTCAGSRIGSVHFFTDSSVTVAGTILN